MHRLRCLVVIGALAVAVSVVGAGSAFAAKGGNNDTAKACQHGGWKAFGRTCFANQGDCVNDGAKGSAPFGTAGKAACTDGINGSFNLDATDTVWSCDYDVPPNTHGTRQRCRRRVIPTRGVLTTRRSNSPPRELGRRHAASI